MDKNELGVLLEQLEELLEEGAVDAQDALEIAMVAGLAERLGGGADPALARAVAWRESGGGDLLRVAFEELEVDEIIDGLEGVLDGEAADEQVEDAVYELDDVVAAAVWSGQAAVVRGLAVEVARTIRQVPEPFAFLADFATDLARLSTVAQRLDVYEYWLAIADAGQYRES